MTKKQEKEDAAPAGKPEKEAPAEEKKTKTQEKGEKQQKAKASPEKSPEVTEEVRKEKGKDKEQEEAKKKEEKKEEAKPSESPEPVQAPGAEEKTTDQPLKKKINKMTLQEIEAKLKDTQKNMGGLESKYAGHLLKRKESLSQK